jgi:hypothetical protein
MLIFAGVLALAWGVLAVIQFGLELMSIDFKHLMEING